MKVRETTPERMVIEDRPWIIGGLIAGFTLVFIAVGLGLLFGGDLFGGLMIGGLGGAMGFLAFWAFVRRTIVFLDRGAGVVLIREASLFGQTETRHPLSAVRGVRVETSRSSNSTSTHRPVLDLIDGQSLPLRKAYVSGRGAGRVAAAIGDWLGQDGPSRGAGL